MTEALERWRAWLGRREETWDILDLNRARAMQATLDVEEPPLEAGDALPPLWHWLYFWSVAPASAIGPDGHAARGGFLLWLDSDDVLLEGVLPRYRRLLEQAPSVARDLSHRKRLGGIRIESPSLDPDVHPYDVPLRELLRARNPVDDLLVHGRADRRRKAAITLEGRDAALAPDVVFH